MLRRLLSTLPCIILFASVAYGQPGQGSLKGKVIDKSTGEPLPFVNVILEMNGVQASGGTSDFDGKFNIKPIPPGSYTLKATFTGYKPKQVNGIVVNAEKITFYDLEMESTVIDIEEFEVVDYSVPLISKDNTSSGGTITREDISKLPGRSATSVAQTVGGVYSADDGSGSLNIRGARSDANYYFIDGIKVRGSTAVPQQAIEQVSVITGGLPAQYGDVTGGVISITTRGPSSRYFGGFEYFTSGFKIGDNVYGLDNFGFNQMEFSLSGPVMFLRDSTGSKDKPLFGFFVAGNVQDILDPRPSALGHWKVKDDVLTQLEQDPLRNEAPPGVGTIQNADFLRLSDLEKIPYAQNARRQSINLNAKLDFNTGPTTNLTVGGTLNATDRNNFSLTDALMNWDNNQQQQFGTWRAYVRFVQRFNTGSQDESSASIIQNAFYSVQADFTREWNKSWDDTHKDNLFNYGYVGEFRRFRQRAYAIGTDSATGIAGNVQTTWEDTLIGFTASDINPLLSRYTERYYELRGWEGYDENGNPVYDRALAGEDLTDFVALTTGGGLLNGSRVPNVYNMWRGPGFQQSGYNRSQRSQFRITATGSADIKDHAISVGFEYEQRVDRGYGASPWGLWTIGRQMTNFHTTNLDFSNPSISFPGPFIDYDFLNSSPGDYTADDEQFFFDYNLRNALGLDPDGTDFINIDELDPEMLDIEFFSADELLNNGSNLVSYFGYDPYGNVLSDDPSFDDFFTARDEFGNLTRPVGAFRPIYVAGFIQDKFSFDDLVFNIGVRVDRYDANQQVLKDPFVLFPTVKAGESLAQELATGGSHPSNIGDDFVVYVDDPTNPSSILGYRDGDTWYSADGSEIADGTSLRVFRGFPAPLLVDRQNFSSEDITSESFEDFKPQTNFMPRVAFSFPISDEALFFAHYDVLTKRPTTGNRLDPTQYYFLEARGGNGDNVGGPVNNPNLKPEKTIDYEVGFQQKLTKSSSLKLSAFYREIRDNVQVVQVVDAFPRTYTTFDNIDFGTVKGLTAEYDLRRTGNLRMRASYTLQFAEGTGSNATSQLNLAATNNQNLRTIFPLSFDQRHTIVATVDYRYGKGKDYNGPIWFGKQVFANTGANFQFNGGSGTPYNAQSNITRQGLLGGRGAALLDGQLNGSRLPWQFRVDARFDRDFELTLGSGDKKKPINLNIYFQILNLFDFKNTISVYRATGNADDDGYLAAAEFQSEIAGTTDEDAFRELYRVRINNPFLFNIPRQIRLGALVQF